MERKIKYSMCWEDPELVIKGLNITNKDIVLTIASGGENVYAILLKEPKEIVAIDSNIYQIYLNKLKSEAIRQLDYNNFCGFIGIDKTNNRWKTYLMLSKFLSEEEKHFWNNNKKYIENGIINCGKFENYLRIFRKFILRFVLNKKQICEYLKSTNLSKQEKFFDEKWNNFLWKLLFKIFFSRVTMKLLGRDKSYFQHNKINNIANHYYNRSKYGITQIPVMGNFFMHMILTGKIPKSFKNHPYLDENNFMQLKKRINHIKYENISIYDHLKFNKRKYTKYNLSDIFEKGSFNEYENLLSLISTNSIKGTKICYWNNMVKRKHHTMMIKFKPLKGLSEKLLKSDRIFFYSDFIIEEKI